LQTEEDQKTLLQMQDLIEKLQTKVKSFKRQSENAVGSVKMDLMGYVLAWKDLKGCLLVRRDLKGCVLVRRDLKGCVLVRRDLKGCVFIRRGHRK